MTDFASLLEKIEAATAADPELDLEIFGAVGGSALPVDGITGSIVGAVLLIGQVLPGWWYTTGNCGLSAHASIGPDVPGPDADLAKHKTFGQGFDADLSQPSTPALALSHVLLQALQAKAEEGLQ